MADRIASLLALAAGIKSTGDDLISIGGKLHNYADALNTEANVCAFLQAFDSELGELIFPRPLPKSD